MTEPDGVEAFWRRLGLPGLIDAHVHFMPDRVLRKVWDYFDRAGPLIGRSWPIVYRLPDESERVEVLRSFGVRRFSALSYPHRPGMAAWLNEWSAQFALRVPDALPSATFYPEPGAAAYVETALAAGAVVCKSHVQVGDYDPRDPLLTPVWGRLEEAGVPTIVHCGSGPRPGRFTGPGPIEEVLRAHPRLRIIVAHLGMPEYSEFLAMADRHPGVYLDTTMVFTEFTESAMPFPRELRARLLDLADRILLGSDFPNIPHPYVDQLTALARLELGEDWLRRVCWANAAALWGVPGGPSALGHAASAAQP